MTTIFIQRVWLKRASSSRIITSSLLAWQLCAVVLTASVLPLGAAVVTWTGQSGDWSAAANWSTGSLPGPSDDVVIQAGPSITVTHSTGSDAVNSIVCSQVFTLSGGSLSVATTFQTDNSLSLSGGALVGATVQALNGGRWWLPAVRPEL